MSRYDLSEFEWQVVAPLLPNKQRGVARVDDRRVLNGIFWVLRSGSPWRDLRERYRAIHDLLQSVPALGKGGGVGSDYGCDYRCLWRRCADDRRHERACSSFSCDFKKSHLERCLGRSRGGLTTEIHALTDGEGLPVKFVITPGNTHDTQAATELLADIQPGPMVLGDKAYDANWLKNYVSDRSG